MTNPRNRQRTKTINAPRSELQQDVVRIRFDTEGHELPAALVAEVLEGLVSLAGDFARAGAFGDGPPRTLMARPSEEGSFVVEVVNWVYADPVGASIVGAPSLATVLQFCTRGIRAKVKDFDHLVNGNVKVEWTDGTASEVRREVWEEFCKRKQQRRKQLNKITVPLSLPDVTQAEVSHGGTEDEAASAPPVALLDHDDYTATLPVDEIKEVTTRFTTEAEMATVDFDSGDRWRVKTRNRTREATVEDEAFLAEISSGTPVRKGDIFQLQIREERVTKNGRTQSKWFVEEVLSHRSRANDDSETA